jgi:signal transduction histidine kinase
LNFDVQPLFWVDAFLYLMLHAAVWYGMARYRSGLVALWSAAGIFSALGVFVLGCRDLLPRDVVVVGGLLFMALGNFGRQWALRSLDGPADRRWLWGMGLFNLVYLVLSFGLHFSGGSEAALMLVFYGFYTFNCLDYVVSGRRVALTHDQQGARSVQMAGVLLVSTLGIKTLALLGGWGATDLYGLGWDQAVVFGGQFIAVTMLSVGFMQIFVDRMNRATVDAQKELVREQERSALLRQHSQDLSVLLSEREEIIRQLTLSNKSAGMGALVASFAHELNQPLAATMLHAELIQSQLQELLVTEPTPRAQLFNEAAGHIVSDTQRASDIIRKLRNLFRMSKGEYVRLDFAQLVGDVLDIVKARAHDKSIRVESRFAPDFMLTGDAIQLQQVVLNLLSNAVDAMEGVTGRPRVLRIEGRHEQGYLVLDVQDSGAGIPITMQDEVFSLFKSSKSEGMGVGLWLSQSIVQAHQGTLSFSSQPGQGTVFTLRLPATEYVLPQGAADR